MRTEKNLSKTKGHIIQCNFGGRILQHIRMETDVTLGPGLPLKTAAGCSVHHPVFVTFTLACPGSCFTFSH